MAQHQNIETTDVVICGCGPTGALLSAYLSRMSIKHVVLERESGITTDPRGIALDEDGIRALQGIGIYDSIYTEIGTCMQKFQFIGGTRAELDKKPFLEMDYATTEGGTGHIGFICHKQPVLEKSIRSVMTSSPTFCQVRLESTVVQIREAGDYTYCSYRDKKGDLHTVRSRFLVGADGKTGYTRKNYLEPLGILMETAHDFSFMPLLTSGSSAFYEETWVALNWEITLPNEKTHTDFPLWRLGYTPEQVYDLFFPENFRFLCNPNRPAVCGRFGMPSDRLWRFEFVVQDGEDGEEMAKANKINDIVVPYLTHPGSRYGLAQDVIFPQDCIRVLRCRPFRFAARSCNRWSHGRVVLCGDAAHVFPPFGGQGIASGFRDAVSLAWRLALLCRHQASGSPAMHENILRGWYLERKQQLEKSLASTIENGRMVTEGSPFIIFLRRCYLLLLHLIPSWRNELRLGRRKDGLIRYQHSPGLPFQPNFNGGLCLPQVYCKLAGDSKGQVFFSDDVIFSAQKATLFQLLVYVKDESELTPAGQMISDIDEISKGEICSNEVTFLVEGHKGGSMSMGNRSLPVFELASASDFACSSLCHGRPEPQHYDPYQLGKAVEGRRFIIVRPDRFVYAACDSKEDLDKAISSLVKYLQGPIEDC
ncbi:hypothetical protein BDV26DRAFT_296196 [Aspergillus bertholletiae]|uniref:FAD-binding domain-containing protein n=1 Tax=Aspergillus bertholletiae TaxID=1226010 RepID=A0A5N7AWG5_9EURO|nr:hypothetical protein BDV26DRAFT_296196 [Aspergillus bertholletiae]